MSTGEILFLILVLTGFTSFAVTLAYYTSWNTDHDSEPQPERLAQELPKQPKRFEPKATVIKVPEHA